MKRNYKGRNRKIIDILFKSYRIWMFLKRYEVHCIMNQWNKCEIMSGMEELISSECLYIDWLGT